MANAQEVAAALRVLAAAYPRFELKQGTIEVYCAMLADVDMGDLQRACIWCIANREFFPTVSELRAGMAETAADKPPDEDQAWSEVLREVRRVGSWGDPQFSHPAISRAVQGVGWKDICMSEKIGVERAHFLRAYEKSIEGHRQERIALPLLQKIVGQLASQKRLTG